MFFYKSWDVFQTSSKRWQLYVCDTVKHHKQPNWTYSEELVDPLNLEVWAYSEDLKSTLWEMFWTHFQDPAPPYTEFGTDLWNSGVPIFLTPKSIFLQESKVSVE